MSSLLHLQLYSKPLLAHCRSFAISHYFSIPHARLRARPTISQSLVPLNLGLGLRPRCFSGEKELFLAANGDLLEQLKDQIMPLEQIATEVFQAMYQRQQAEFSWNTNRMSTG